MREQWLGMYLPVLVLISMEVILMSHDTEGASASMVQRRSRINSGNVMKIEPSDAGYQLPNGQVTSSRKARDIEDRTDHLTSGGLRMKNGRLKRSNLSPDQSALTNQPELPCTEFSIDDQDNDCNGRENSPSSKLPLPNEKNTHRQSAIDFDNLMNNETPGAGFDIGDTHHNTQPTGLPFDFESPYIQINSILAQIISLLMPLMNGSLSVPPSVPQMNQTNPDLQPHEPVLEPDPSTLPNPITQITNLLESQATTTPKTSSPETEVPPSAAADVDRILSVFCGLAKLLIYELNTSFTNAILEAIEIMNNSSNIFYPDIVQKNSSQSPSSTPPISLESIIEYLNSSIPDVEQSVDGLINPLELALDYLVHAHPDIESQKSLSQTNESLSLPGLIFNFLNTLQPTIEPKSLFSGDTKSIDLHELVSNYYNPSDFANSPGRPSKSNDNSKNPIKSILDFWNFFAENDTEFRRNTIVSKFGNSEQKTLPLKPSKSPVNLKKTYLLKLEPLGIAHQSGYLPSSKNFLDTIESVIDYFNPFRPSTQSPQNYNVNATTPIHIILDNLKSTYLKNDEQKSLPQHQHPVVLQQSPLGYSPPSRNFLDTIESIIDYFNPFRPSTRPPQNYKVNNSIPVHVILDNVKPSNLNTDQQTSLPQQQHPVIVIQPPVDHEHPNYDTTPSQLDQNVQNPVHIVADEVKPLKPATDNQKPLQPDKNPTQLISLIDILNAIKLQYNNLKPDKSVVKQFSDLEPKTVRPLATAHEAIRPPNFLRLVEPTANSSQLGIHRRNPLRQEDSHTDLPGPIITDILNSIWDKLQLPQPDQVHVNPNFQPMDPTSDSRSAYYSSRLNRMRRHTREVKCSDIPSDYHQVEGISRAYKLDTSSLNWRDAQLKCESEDGELALPEDQPQYDSIIMHARNMINDDNFKFHVGFHRSGSGESWTTVRGDPLPFESWADGDVADNDVTNNDVTEKQCGGIFVSSIGLNGLTSEECTKLLPFMCQKMIPPQCV